MIDMSDENKQYMMGDVIARMKTVGHGNVPNDHLCAAVIKSYLKLVFEAILKGFVVDLPRKFGQIYIQKKTVNPEKTTYYADHKRNTGKAINLNMKRLGFKYEFVLISEVVKKFGYRIQVDIDHRKELQRILTETDFDYRTNLI